MQNPLRLRGTLMLALAGKPVQAAYEREHEQFSTKSGCRDWWIEVSHAQFESTITELFAQFRDTDLLKDSP